MINDVTKFLLAGFKFKSNYFESMIYLKSLGFRNCYLCKQYISKAQVYLEFEYKYSKEFLQFHQRMKRNSLEIIHKDGFIVYLVDYPKLFRQEYYYFTKGRYSAFRSHYKLFFPKFYKLDGKVTQSKLYNIINKDILAKIDLETRFKIKITENMEYYPIWDQKTNIYNNE